MTSYASPPSDGAPYAGALEITDIRIRLHSGPREPEILKAFATITLNDVFVVHDLKVIQKPERLFVSMPACQSKNGRYRDIAHPIAKEFRDYMEAAVLEAYRREGGEEVAADTVSEAAAS